MRCVLVLSSLIMIAGSAATAAELDAARYGWFTDYRSGMAEAKRTGKPIMLVFRCQP